jgi:uncharacterized membrane protein YeaQ/YmgE (transglycosylase-associated protein family)
LRSFTPTGHAGKAFGLHQAGQAAGFIASLVGAVLLLFVYALVKSKVKQALALGQYLLV